MSAVVVRRKVRTPRMTAKRFQALAQAIVAESAAAYRAVSVLREYGAQNGAVEAVERCSARRIQKLMNEHGLTAERYAALFAKHQPTFSALGAR